MTQLDINALNALRPFCGKDNNRYYMQGVHIFDRDNERIYEATNGHYLARIYTEKPDDSNVDLILKFSKRIKGTLSTLDGNNNILTDKDLIKTDSWNGCEWSVDCDRILNEFTNAKPAYKYINFNPHYLATICDFFGDDWYHIQPPVCNEFKDPSPCFWQSRDKTRIAALMPIRL